MIKVIWLISIILMFSSCGGILREDLAPVPADHGYMTVETILNNHRSLGVNGGFFKEGERTNGRNLSIITIGRGQLTLLGCGLDYAIYYWDSQTVRIPLDALFGKEFDESERCALTIQMSPKYPGQENQANVVYGFMGIVQFYIVEKDADYLIINGKKGWDYKQIRLGHDANINFILPTNIGKNPFIVACPNFKTEGEMEDNELIKLKLSDIQLDNNGNCEIAVKKDDKFYHAMLTLQVFDEKVRPLAFPIVTLEQHFGKNKLTVRSPHQVSWVRINDKEFNGLVSRVPYSVDKVFWIRQYTIAGRANLVGFYNGHVIYAE